MIAWVSYFFSECSIVCSLVCKSFLICGTDTGLNEQKLAEEVPLGLSSIRKSMGPFNFCSESWVGWFFFFTYKPRRKVILLLMKESIYNSILTDLWLYIIIFHLNDLSLQIGLVSPFQLLVYLSAIYCLILFFNPIFFNTYMSSLNGGLQECDFLAFIGGFCDDLYTGSCYDPLYRSKCHCLEWSEI